MDNILYRATSFSVDFAVHTRKKLRGMTEAQLLHVHDGYIVGRPPSMLRIEKTKDQNCLFFVLLTRCYATNGSKFTEHGRSWYTDGPSPDSLTNITSSFNYAILPERLFARALLSEFEPSAGYPAIREGTISYTTKVSYPGGEYDLCASIDDSTGLIAGFSRYKMEDGNEIFEFSRVEFTNWQLNAQTKDSDFVVTPPAGLSRVDR
jgi:hypothetical protein